MNILEVILSTAKAKISPLLGKVKMWMKPAYIKNKLLMKIRGFFAKAFDVRPKDETDYYAVGSYLVSKKLVLAFSFLVIALCGYYILSTIPAKSDSDSVYKAYKYNSIALQSVSGNVEILGKSGYTAYIGNVDSGVVTGTGTLYNPAGNVVYTGEFASNKYNGSGKLYFENSNLKYEGTFVDNLYEGEGKEYREDGSLLYEGEYANGKKSGEGKLYDSKGNAVYSGNFIQGNVRYQELIGKATKEVADIYTGEKTVYESNSDYCVYMKDISALYCAKDATDSLEETWKVSAVYVLKSEINLDGMVLSGIEDIKNVLGEPVYEGNTNLVLADEVALKLAIEEKGDALFGEAKLIQKELYSDVYQIEEYEKDYIAYLYVFEKDGIMYQFFCRDIGEGFSFYSME